MDNKSYRNNRLGPCGAPPLRSLDLSKKVAEVAEEQCAYVDVSITTAGCRFTWLSACDIAQCVGWLRRFLAIKRGSDRIQVMKKCLLNQSRKSDERKQDERKTGAVERKHAKHVHLVESRVEANEA
ncbi:hypothetical protein EVAR_32371_1 [Eumeta japonica]|uniref:Uncharacterized protein n=1 Tax=Eumeta variegata TaxID=151549 RepID=A0A4C1VM37_EUMVA|nr:hypothetical protein EVAR_32371_1 [Eumeta japonica]